MANIQQNLAKFGEICEILEKTAKKSAIFNENFEIRERCKGVHCVDLGESFPTSIYLQNLASIQPRTSLVKFARVFEVGALLEHLGDLYAESGQTLQGSFSALSKPHFASKDSLESSRRDLHNALLCTAFGIAL